MPIADIVRVGDRPYAFKVRGPELAEFRLLSSHCHAKLFFNNAKNLPQRRDYTPVRFDERWQELTLIFVVRDGGSARDWALDLQTGVKVSAGRPRGSMIISGDLGWYPPVDDLTAWLAVERRLQELADATHSVVIVQSNDVRDLAALPQRPNMVAKHVGTSGDVLQAARELLLPPDETSGNGFAWCAGEASTMAQLRHVLINERGLPRTQVKASAYWKPGAEGFHESLE
ncbi:siderophore-interacting protein [Hydrogenophaga sp. 5NK40-0174]|uniref:siderophore-interacting protein n=1 Tax=Hydrogenophaga sp. 5NK40-0174 TaxID=3127649 RepID=UPI0031042CE4